MLGSCLFFHGFIKTSNTDGKETAHLGTTKDGDGILAIKNKDEQIRLGIGITSEGDAQLELINNKGNTVVSIGSLHNEKHNADGFINLSVGGRAENNRLLTASSPALAGFFVYRHLGLAVKQE